MDKGIPEVLECDFPLRITTFQQFLNLQTEYIFYASACKERKYIELFQFFTYTPGMKVWSLGIVHKLSLYHLFHSEMF